MAAVQFGTVTPGHAPSGLAITWLNAYRMRKTVACSVRTITKSGWTAWTTARQAWCRFAVQARAGMIRIDANSLKNQQLAIDACIILKPSAVTVTASRPRESSDVPPISKEISFNAFYRSAESWLSDIKRSAINPFIYFNVHSIDSSASDELKNPRAALTLPGGDLIVAIVKHDQNPNSTHLTIPRRCPLWPMWAKPLVGLALPALKWLLPMASNNHLCADIFLSQYIDKCQEKMLYVVYPRAYR